MKISHDSRRALTKTFCLPVDHHCLFAVVTSRSGDVCAGPQKNDVPKCYSVCE